MVTNFDNHVAYQMVFNKKIGLYHRYPDHLLTTLAKVGGLLGLLKLISFALVVHHKRLFEQSYQSNEEETEETEERLQIDINESLNPMKEVEDIEVIKSSNGGSCSK